MEDWNRAQRAIGLGVLIALTPAALAAQDAPAGLPQVSLTIEGGCTTLDEAVITRVLAVELRSLAALSEPTATTRAAVEASCADDRVVLTLIETHGDRRLSRELDLSGAAGRSRLVALAIAELIGASFVVLPEPVVAEPVVAAPPPPEVIAPEEVALVVTPVPIDPELRPDAPEPSAPPAVPDPWGVHLFAAGAIAGEPFHASGGGGAGIDAELVLPLALRVDLRAMQGVVSAAPGEVRMTEASAGAFLALRATFARSLLDVGLGGRGGLGILEGQAAGGRLLVGPSVAIAATAQLSLEVARAIYAHVGVEVGWTVVGVSGTDADGAIIARAGGPSLVLTLGMEVRPPR